MDIDQIISENNLNIIILILFLISFYIYQNKTTKQIENMVWEKSRDKRRLPEGKKEKRKIRLDSKKRLHKNPNFDMLHDSDIRELRQDEIADYKDKLGKQYEYLLEKYQVKSDVGYLRKLNKTITQQRICDEMQKKYYSKIK